MLKRIFLFNLFTDRIIYFHGSIHLFLYIELFKNANVLNKLEIIKNKINQNIAKKIISN